ncbi:hypothetical protein LRS74_17335 [Streptomyces sp. LX-29]|uniref:hypothetical protein n=1 Tax=Streptomyces sp. LX-29 TaxID=2900152 RepID=UPI00240DC752|nr:hypothetical protein [Streptomyces sp. LX-29]WFB08615.1 hypothetical protein LRS74_17335 [Streptomyces sp. LX-29]
MTTRKDFGSQEFRPLTLGELSTPVLALHALATVHASLPAPSLSISTIYPDQLSLQFFGDLAAFEAWREALSIEPGGIEYGEQSGGRTRVLTGYTEYAGARIRLTAYGDVLIATAGGGA